MIPNLSNYENGRLGRDGNKEINRTNIRALRVLHKDYDASFEMCLQRKADTTIHIKNLQKLMLEVFKTLNSMNPSSEIFSALSKLNTI